MIFKSLTPDVSIPNISVTDYLMPRLAGHGDKAAEEESFVEEIFVLGEAGGVVGANGRCRSLSLNGANHD